MDTAGKRILISLAVVGAVIFLGGLALWAIGGGHWTLAEGLFMAATSAATVGSSDLDVHGVVPAARPITLAIILIGIGAIAFFQSSLTAFFVESDWGEAFRRRKMDKTIAALKDHIVVAGCGSTGRHVIAEFLATRTPFVVIDRDRANVAALGEELGGEVLCVEGDATHDATLVHAGIERAKGLIAALTHDRDNLYVTLSGRTLNPQARIIAKVVEPEALPKMIRAGANATVSPNTIGGIRMASEMIRPSVVQFLDLMLRDKDKNLRIEEATIPAGSGLIGKTIMNSRIHESTNTLIVAVRNAEGKIIYNPPRDHVLAAESVVIVLGEVADIGRLREYVKRGPA